MRREASPLGEADEGIEQLQALAVELTGQPLGEIIAIGALQEDGSLRIASHPGGKRRFSAEQVQDARKAVEAARAAIGAPKRKEKKPKAG